MKRFNIVTKKTYKGRNGEDKNQWNQVGSLVCFPATQDKPEGYALELNMFPDVKFYVFEQKPRDDRQGGGTRDPNVEYAEQGSQVVGEQEPW